MPVSAVSPYPNYNAQDAWSAQGAQKEQDLFPKKKDDEIPGIKKKDDSSSPKGKKQLTPEQEKEIEKLKKRDAEVRAHEQAHVAAGGGYIKGGISYSYQKGPDGTMYAVGGEVSIDTSPVKNNPQATIAKMEAVKAAALAPADPSGADRAVAAAAQQEEAKAQQEQSKQKTGKGQNGTENAQPPQEASVQEKSPSTSTYSSKGQKNANVNPLPQLVNLTA
jgi:hypothetical protein